MTKDELKKQLKKAGLSKKEFCEIVGLSYQSVNNWGSSKNIPHWVDSWLELYVESKFYRELKNKIVNSGLCREFERLDESVN